MSERKLLSTVPPLQNGDRLNRIEFERRYHTYPDKTKFELIEGVAFMASPVTQAFHSSPHADVNGWLYLYRRKTPNTSQGDNGTLKLDLDNEPQPDAYLYIEADAGGRSRMDGDGYMVGAPELVIEIAASSASLDSHGKKAVYATTGVPEYLLWRVYDNVIEWFVNRGGTFQLMTTSDGILRSEVFPGLWLDPAAMLAGDLDRSDAVIAQGLASPEHAAFVQKLQAAAAQGATP
jgi:Uma2 family endonuclease